MFTAVKPHKTPSIKKPLNWAKLPMLWAIILGVISGLVCQRLPDNIRSFLVEGLAEPISSVVLALIAGVTGPVIFLSLITSITSLGSISKLTNLGFKIMWRFIKCTLFIIGVSIMVSLLFYSVFGEGAIQFNPDQLVSMLLNLIPTNIVAPFLNNNTPQLVILGILMGAALLLLEDRVANLAASLRSLQEWSSSVMRLVFVLTPVIPFISLFKACRQKCICFVGRLGIHRRRICHTRHLLPVQAGKGIAQVQAQHSGTPEKGPADGFPGLYRRI